MNYKIVNVYTGYAEFGIQNIEIENSDLSVADFANMVGERLVKKIEEGAEFAEWVRVFFGFFATVGDIGVVNNGEENILVIVPEGHEWYGKVKYKMDEREWDEWVMFIDSICMFEIEKV